LRYAIVFLGFLLQNLLQFVLQLILAWSYGTASAMDAYYAAMTLPVAISAMVAGAVQPLIVTALGQDRKSSEDTSAVPCLVWIPLVVCCLTAAVLTLISLPLMSWLHPGFTEQKSVETAQLFRILVWLVPCNAAIGLMQAVLNGFLRFGVPAAAGVLGPLLTVTLVPLLVPSLGIAAVAWATLAGAVLNVAIQTPLAQRLLRSQTGRGALQKVRQLLPLAVPIVLGMVLLKIDPLVDRYVSSFLDDGSISRFGYAFRVITIFVTLASGTLSTVAFPVIAQRASAGTDQIVHEVSRALRMLLTLVVPAVVVFLCFSGPLVRDLFERGAFTAADTVAVARLIRISALFLAGAALGELGAKVFFVLDDSRTPTLIGGCCLVLGMIAKLILVPTQGITALAWIAACVFAGAGIGTMTVLARRIGMQIFTGVLIQLVRCTAAAAVAAGIGFALLQTTIPFPAVVGLSLGAVGYFAAMAMLDAETGALVRTVLAGSTASGSTASGSTAAGSSQTGTDGDTTEAS